MTYAHAAKALLISQKQSEHHMRQFVRATVKETRLFHLARHRHHEFLCLELRRFLLTGGTDFVHHG